MKLLSLALGCISCALILSLMAIIPQSRSAGSSRLPHVHLPTMTYGKKICIDQRICVVTVDHKRRWFVDGQEILSPDMLHKNLSDSRVQQHATSRKAYVKCRIDQRCPARDFLDFYAAAQANGFDGIMIAGTYDD